MKNSNKKKIIFEIITFVIGILLFFVAFKLIKTEKFITTIEEFGILKFFIFSSLGLIYHLFASLRLKYILSFLKEKLPWFYILKIRLITFQFAFLTPTMTFGAEPFKVGLLKNEKNVSIDKSWSAVLIESFFEILMSGVIFILSILYLIFEFVFPKKIELTLIATAIITLTFFLYILRSIIYKRKFLDFILEKLEKVEFPKNSYILKNLKKINKNFINFFYNRKKEFVFCLVFSFLIIIYRIIEMYILLLFLGILVGIKEIFLITILMNLIFLVPIPMFIGIGEIGQIALFSLINLKEHYGVSVSFIFRLSGLIYSIFGFIGWIINNKFYEKLYSSSDKKLN